MLNIRCRVIFDSDFGPDYDDVGAITLLHSFADSGYIRILATMASSRHKNVAAALNVFNTYFKKPDIPIGVVSKNGLDLGDRQHWTDSVISRYPHHIESNNEVPEALEPLQKIACIAAGSFCYYYHRWIFDQPCQFIAISTGFFLRFKWI